ncbi:hypothetical protein FRB94_013500 [Tulasnella sp. JGI-2019a]|nr:hypothetical protein FRB93_010962 [Tulasnella sp. JGI-2019a]KAG8990281.1 hypothetical protein FRB94_013500 [Tulasnella sp. JGI-2019a]KAG9024417.1 hypothetical protein FRB95_011535 [Tulasnella sp. JGI-2019a]
MDTISQQPPRPNGSLGLPSELLTTILQNTLPNIWHKDIWGRERIINTVAYYHQLCLLRGICFVWKEAIDASPNVWALVGNTTPDFNKCLFKSKNASLTIGLREQPANSKELANWEKCLGVISRWGVVDVECHLEGDRGERYVSALEASPAPMLRVLNLAAYASNDLRIHIFGGVAPCLRELRLRHISLKHWDSPFLFNLRELSLNGVHGLTIEQVLAILEACVHLEKLSLILVHINNASPSTSASEPRRDINLSSLKSFAISGLDPTATNRLLQTIQTPSCRKFMFQLSSFQRPKNDPICCKCVDTAFRSFLITAEDVRVTITTKSFNIIDVRATQRNDRSAFNVHLRAYSSHFVWSTFVPLFILETIPIELTFGSNDQDVLLETSAWAMHGVWKVVSRLGMGMEKIIQELGFAKAIDGEFRWLWPRLCELSVFGVSGEELLRMLEARAEAAIVGRVSDYQQRMPVPIKLLILGRSCTVSPTILEDLRRFVGKVVMESPAET